MNIDKNKVEKAKQKMEDFIFVCYAIDREGSFTKQFEAAYKVIKTCECFGSMIISLSHYKALLKKYDNYNKEMDYVFDNIYAIIFENMKGTEEERLLQQAFKNEGAKEQ